MSAEHPPSRPAYGDATSAALYDTFNPWGAADDFYRTLATAHPGRVLDIGCGTGTLACALARDGNTVTALDPSADMLAQAQHKPGYDAVNWLCGTAETSPALGHFDLIIMTGHAFQCLRCHEDELALFDRVAQWLAPEGLFAFETRNPELDWVARWHGRTRRVPHGDTELVETTTARRTAPNAIRVEQTVTRGGSPVFTHHDTLRFASESDILHALTTAGLRVASHTGDWDGSPFDPLRSLESLYCVCHGH